MNGRRIWFIPLGVLGLVLGASAAGGQDKAAPPAAKALSPKELAEVIDKHIEAKWAKAKATAAAPASDAEFVRRIYLDLGGRIPKVADARAFLDSQTPDKRAKLIEDLLAGPQYVDHFSNTWRSVMISSQATPQASFLGRNFQMWLVDKIRDNVPYDKLVFDILTAGANSPGKGGKFVGGAGFNQFGNGALAFFQANENKPENLAAATSRVFLGVRLECAQCHNHPFSEWKKDQFWEMAAFFNGGPGSGPFIPVPAGGQPAPQLPKGVIAIPGTGKKVNAKFLDGKAPEFRDGLHIRETLAEWVTSPKNPYFAKNTANRLWGHFFGVGLIDPVDDEPTKENPPSHPELLKILAEQLAAHQFDVKYMMRAITLSKTYQRSSVHTHPSQKNPRLFAKGSVRGLTAEQLFDSLLQATGFQDNSVTNPVYFNLNSVRSKFIADFSSTDQPTETQTSILQALKLMNGKFITDATSLETSQTLAAVAESPFFDTPEKIKVLFLATLTRYPTESELNQFTTYVKSGGPRNDQKLALGDVFWALLNTSEFRLNH